MTILAQDTFIRANQSGWGTASDGSTWTDPRGAGSYAIASNEGTNSTNGGTFSVARIGSGTSANQEILVRLKPADTTSDIGTIGRFVDSNNFYYGILVGGTAVIGKDVAGTFSTLTSTSFSYTTSNFYWIRFKLIGTKLYLRIWQDGTSEPTSWTLSTTDSSIASGGYGVGSDATGSTSFDSLTVTDGTVAKDIATRFRLMSANQLKDIASRFRLMSSNQLKDISSRFRLMSSTQPKDVSSRFRLMSANQQKDIAARLRLMSALQLKDVATRLRLMSAAQTKDIAARFRLMSASQLKDISARLRLMSALQLKDISSRLRLMSASQLRDIAARFVLASSATRLKDIACRFILTGGVGSGLTYVTTVTFRDGETGVTFRDGVSTATFRDGLVQIGGR